MNHGVVPPLLVVIVGYYWWNRSAVVMVLLESFIIIGETAPQLMHFFENTTEIKKARLYDGPYY